MPKDIPITIRPENEFIDWSAKKIQKGDDVYLIGEERSMTAERLLRLLRDPRSKLDNLLAATEAVHLQVSYWTLFDLRDRSLDGSLPPEQAKEALQTISDGRRRQPVSTLNPADADELRGLLLRIPNLIVWFDDTDVLNSDDVLRACYVGVIRTFTNIGDLHYGWCDKYGWHVKEHIRDCWHRWGARTARIIRLHGSDDNCGLGEWDDECKFLETCQGGPEFRMEWDEVVESIPKQFRDMTHHLAMNGTTLEGIVGTPALKHMTEFLQLRDVRMWGAEIELKDENVYVHAGSKERYWVVDIPAMPRLIDFDLEIDEVHGPKDAIILFRFGETPNLKGVNIRFTCDDVRGVVVRPGRPWEWFSRDKELTLAEEPYTRFGWMMAGIDYGSKNVHK